MNVSQWSIEWTLWPFLASKLDFILSHAVSGASLAPAVWAEIASVVQLIHAVICNPCPSQFASLIELIDHCVGVDDCLFQLTSADESLFMRIQFALKVDSNAPLPVPSLPRVLSYMAPNTRLGGQQPTSRPHGLTSHYFALALTGLFNSSLRHKSPSC